MKFGDQEHCKWIRTNQPKPEPLPVFPEAGSAEQLEGMLDEAGLSLSELLTYLDDLRESGVTNMYGAAPYLCENYGLDRKLAGEVLGYWMRTFTQRHPQQK